jgi:hypothetical protein
MNLKCEIKQGELTAKRIMAMIRKEIKLKSIF